MGNPFQQNPFAHLPPSLQPPKGLSRRPVANDPLPLPGFSRELARAAMGPEPTFNSAYAPSALANYLRMAAYQEQHSVNPETDAADPYGSPSHAGAVRPSDALDPNPPETALSNVSKLPDPSLLSRVMTAQLANISAASTLRGVRYPK